MVRRSLLRASTFAFVLSGLSLAAYGCSTTDDGDGDAPKDPVEGGTLPDGAPIRNPPGQDGSTILPDGAPAQDGAPGTDGAIDDADGGVIVDSGTDTGIVDPPDPPTGPLSVDYVDYQINHVLVTGQSNSVATGGGAALSTTQPYGNLRFDTGVMSMTQCDGNGCKAYAPPGSFVPLIQADGFYGGTTKAETTTSGLADEISYLAQERYEFGSPDRPTYPTKHDVLASVHGRSGNTYACLRKGFCNYNLARGHISPFGQGTSEVTDAKALAGAAGKSYVVRAVVTVHGESDHYAYERAGGHTEFPMNGSDGTPGKIKDYKDALVEWQQDYEAMAKGITGQAQPVPMFLNAVSGWTTTRTSRLVQMQLDAHIAAPGKVIYVTPAYPFGVMNDCNHFSPAGERQLGEYFGKVYAKVVFGHKTWEPVRPQTITRGAGAQSKVITVKYHVPEPPLVFDTTRVVAAPNMGFDVVDNGVMLTVSNVSIISADTVAITVVEEPTGVNLRLRYAQNQVTGQCIGPGLVYSGGARGNLRDSDATPSKYGYSLFNWGANFDFPVN